MARKLTKSTPTKRGRGRPSIVALLLPVGLRANELAHVDAYRKRRGDITRPEAVRRIIEDAAMAGRN